MVDRARRMLSLRDDAIRQVGNSGISARATSPSPLTSRRRSTCCRGRCADTSSVSRGSRSASTAADSTRSRGQVMDREFDVGFVKDEPAFQELRSVLVYSDEMILIASPRHPLARVRTVQVKDLGSESFLVHHLCVVDRAEDPAPVRVTRHALQHRRGALELREHQALRSAGRRLGVRAPHQRPRRAGRRARSWAFRWRDSNMPRRIFMVYRNRGYVSDSAQQFIDVMGQFNWDDYLPRPESRASSGRPVLQRVRRLQGTAS